MPGSPNKTMISTLVETFKQKVDPAKLYDTLRKISDDLDKSYSALFDGPLPAVSGKNLDLTEVPHEKFPSSVAFEDEENIFTENQLVDGEGLSWLTRWHLEDGTISDSFGRMKEIGNGKTLFSSGLDWDGANFSIDDVDGAGILIGDTPGRIDFVKVLTGVDTKIMCIMPTGVVTMGAMTSGNLTGAGAHELVFKNAKGLRGVNAGGTKTIVIGSIDSSDLVALAPDNLPDGTGHLQIPNVATADLPAAGATRNGLLVIDKGTNRLCYYASGNRYKIAIGTSF